MTWFKIDDGFYDHPKFLHLSNGAVGLWVKAGAWCAKHLTDGVIPAAKVKTLRGTPTQVSALVSSGLWTQIDTEMGAKAYRFHDWNDFQPTREQKEKERTLSAERQRKSRQQKSQDQGQRKNVTRDSHVTGECDSRVSHEGVSQCPDPTRPDPVTSPNGDVHAQTSGLSVSEFATFWSVYPRKVGKKKARSKYAAAVKRAGDEQTVIDGARRLAKDPNLPEQQFIPHPTTWLERDGWEDEPLPSRAQGAGVLAGYDASDWLDPGQGYIDAEVVQLREIGQ